MMGFIFPLKVYNVFSYKTSMHFFVSYLMSLKSWSKKIFRTPKITCGVSQKVLNEKLQELERDGLIKKITYPEVPPRVEFELTEMGKELFPSLEMIQN